jgi:hypothetical protein
MATITTTNQNKGGAMKRLSIFFLVISLLLFVGITIAGETVKADNSPPVTIASLVATVQPQLQEVAVVLETDGVCVAENFMTLRQPQSDIIAILQPAPTVRTGPTCLNIQNMDNTFRQNHLYNNMVRQDKRERMSHYKSASMGA